MSRVAVVGIGYWGPNLVRNFVSQGTLDGVVACDSDAGRLKQLCRQFPSVEAIASVDKVLAKSDIEAVAIATPVRLHFPMAKAALEAGKHVLIEKPMTMNSAEAETLIDLAERKGLTLMVDHTFIYTGAVQKIAEIVRSGDFGNFYYIDSIRVNLGLFQHDVDVIWDLVPHDLSIVNYVLRRAPQIVRATGQCHTDNGLVDVAYLNVEYGDAIAANFHVNWLSPTKVRQMMFGGSKRMIVWNDLDPAEKLRVYDRGIEVTQKDKEGLDRLQIGYRLGDAWLPQIDQTEALRRMTGHFIDCFQNRKVPMTSGKDGLAVVHLLEASHLSLKNGGRPVALSDGKMCMA